MFSGVIADSSQLSMLTRVLDRHCLANNITDAAERDTIGHQIVILFGEGLQTEDALVARLQDERS